jgi:hypothetical protein
MEKKANVLWRHLETFLGRFERSPRIVDPSVEVRERLAKVRIGAGRASSNLTVGNRGKDLVHIIQRGADREPRLCCHPMG